MKKNFLLLCFSILAFAAQAQNEVMLHLSPRLGTAAFALNTVAPHPGGTYNLKYTRFEYYISEIKVTHDGGQIAPVTGMHLLVRPALDSMYSLGQMPGVNNVEAITFSVGVEQAMNHLDPTSFPAGHPLAPQNPDMQWGWTAGYRFAAIEGESGGNLDQHFEIHALGDANYKTQTISTNAEQVAADMKMIHLIADYTQAVKTVNLAIGPIVHGTSGAAVTVLNNFKSAVFTAQTSSAVIQPGFEGSFSVSPNPLTNHDVTQVMLSLPVGHDYLLQVTDLTGKLMLRQPLTGAENQTVALPNMPTAGLYFVHLMQDNQPIAVEKLIILD
jgi:hypothetical protein